MFVLRWMAPRHTTDQGQGILTVVECAKLIFKDQIMNNIRSFVLTIRKQVKNKNKVEVIATAVGQSESAQHPAEVSEL